MVSYPSKELDLLLERCAFFLRSMEFWCARCFFWSAQLLSCHVFHSLEVDFFLRFRFCRHVLSPIRCLGRELSFHRKMHLMAPHLQSRTHFVGAAVCPTARMYWSEIRAASRRASELLRTHFEVSANNWRLILPLASKHSHQGEHKATVKTRQRGQP